MQLPTWLGHVVKSGEVTLFTGGMETLQLRAENNKIELNMENKEFLKDAVGNARTGGSIRSSLAQLKSLAEELKDEGLTVTISYKGDRVVTIGSEANPKLSRMITRTSAVEINDLRKLIELGI